MVIAFRYMMITFHYILQFIAFLVILLLPLPSLLSFVDHLHAAKLELPKLSEAAGGDIVHVADSENLAELKLFHTFQDHDPKVLPDFHILHDLLVELFVHVELCPSNEGRAHEEDSLEQLDKFHEALICQACQTE